MTDLPDGAQRLTQARQHNVTSGLALATQASFASRTKLSMPRVRSSCASTILAYRGGLPPASALQTDFLKSLAAIGDNFPSHEDGRLLECGLGCNTLSDRVAIIWRFHPHLNVNVQQ